ncbi:hypothetical protein [Nocardia altamirensis]|nr:hypothetical protein [Nocardia altamirensis]
MDGDYLLQIVPIQDIPANAWHAAIPADGVGFSPIHPYSTDFSVCA